MTLQTEQNTRTVERRIRVAFRAWAHRRTFATVYEHGQWWVLADDRDGERLTYSVVDASGPGSTDGFDFERV